MRPKLTRELLAELFPRTVGAQQSPQEKAGGILRRAVNDPDLLDAIQERACMRWEHGYSDSLMSAVLCDLTEIEEEREYTNTPDEKQAAFLRRLGFAEEDIMNPKKCPSVWVKQTPKTDWVAELAGYRQE